MPLTGEAKRKYQREWLARRRADYFADKRCTRCGDTEMLRLDHIDPIQKVSHKIWSWSAVRRNVELAKCQVLCEPCHQIKTAEDFNWNQHGIARRYSHDGCRCVECTEAHRIQIARWRNGDYNGKYARKESNPLPLD